MNIDFAIGLHIVGFLASHSDELVSSNTLAKTFGTSPVVLRRILARMNKAGLVSTQRGAHGGSKLARDATDMNLKEVYESVSNHMEVFARHPQGEGAISSVLGGFINEFYLDAETEMFKHLESVSVANMDAVVRPRLMEALNCKNLEPQ